MYAWFIYVCVLFLVLLLFCFACIYCVNHFARYQWSHDPALGGDMESRSHTHNQLWAFDEFLGLFKPPNTSFFTEAKMLNSETITSSPYTYIHKRLFERWTVRRRRRHIGGGSSAKSELHKALSTKCYKLIALIYTFTHVRIYSGNREELKTTSVTFSDDHKR